MQKLRNNLLLMLLFLCLAGCANNPQIVPPHTEPLPVHTDAEEPSKPQSRDVNANEVGKIMILMYHVIGAEKEAPWIQTIENFQRDLETLYEEGYSLLALSDYLENNIQVPAGKTPVIMTFDDGTAGHLRYLEKPDGQLEIDPQCAVGALLAFAKEHPDFGHVATFFINDAPFGQSKYSEQKIKDLVELGFEIGNHTLTHPKLNQLSDEEIQKELALLAQMVTKIVPGYQVNSLALPFGLAPKNSILAHKGEYGDYQYEHAGILRVGANPALSPNAQGFDPYRLPRVQASTIELAKWLEYFRKNPHERYISDGDPLQISLPESKKDILASDSLGEKKVFIYTQ